MCFSWLKVNHCQLKQTAFPCQAPPEAGEKSGRFTAALPAKQGESNNKEGRMRSHTSKVKIHLGRLKNVFDDAIRSNGFHTNADKQIFICNFRQGNYRELWFNFLLFKVYVTRGERQWNSGPKQKRVNPQRKKWTLGWSLGLSTTTICQSGNHAQSVIVAPGGKARL